MIFTCKAWKVQRVQAARYTLALMTGLMHDVAQVHHMNLACMQQISEYDLGLLDSCVRPCSPRCPRFTILSVVIPNLPFTRAHCIARLQSAYDSIDRAPHLRSCLHASVSGLLSKHPDCSDWRAVGESCIRVMEHRNYLIDVLNIHGNVDLLLLPHNAIPDSLDHLCGSSIQNLYSRSGRLQYIDIFIHVYIAQFLKLIDPLRKCQQLSSGCV